VDQPQVPTATAGDVGGQDALARMPTGVDGSDALAELLRGVIHRGELLPGDRLPPERELAARFGVGRMTLRRALAVLQDEGYLLARRGAGGGTFVTSLDLAADRWLERMREHADELDELLELRMAVEVHAARLAARRRGARHVADMTRAITDLDDTISRARVRQLDSDFHQAVAAAADNRRLAETVAACRAELFASTDRLAFDELVAQMREEHAAVRDAVAGGDEDRAARAMTDHLCSARVILHRILAEGR